MRYPQQMAESDDRLRVAVTVTTRSPYEASIVRGVLRYSDQIGHWRFIHQRNQPFLEFEDLDLNEVDGVIGGFYHKHWATRLKQHGIVAVNTSNQHEHLPLPRVSPDDFIIGRMGGEYLLKRGFGQYGFVTHGDSWFSQRRLAGFIDIVEQRAGRPCHVFDADGLYGAESYEPIRDWIEHLPRPIAIMAANDNRGKHVIEAATELGLRVPEDVAVLGVDNNEWVSALTSTPMSSIQLNGHEIGFRAAEVLADLIAGREVVEHQHILPTGIITRRSTDVIATEDALVSKAMSYIQDHCQQGISVENVLEHLGVSRKTLENRMKRSIGLTPQVAIFKTQVELAKTMLMNSNTSMRKVSIACGFKQQARFNIVFKRITGMTPGQYRQQHMPTDAQA